MKYRQEYQAYLMANEQNHQASKSAQSEEMTYLAALNDQRSEEDKVVDFHIRQTLNKLLAKAKEKAYKSPTTQNLGRSENEGCSYWQDDSLIPVIAIEDLEAIIKELVG